MRVTIAWQRVTGYTLMRMEQARSLHDADTAHVSAADPPQQGSVFAPRHFRNALGRFATGVTVVTMRVAQPESADQGGLRVRTYGITVNAFMSVSLDPPLIAVSIDKRSRAHPTLLAAERFGVSVLAHSQESLSDAFAGRPVRAPEAPFEEFSGFPVISGAITQLVCRSYQAHAAGDHTIFIGEVEALRYAEGQPLLFYKGQYAELPAAQAVR